MNYEKVDIPAKDRHRWGRVLRPQLLIAMDQIRYLVFHKIQASFQEHLRDLSLIMKGPLK